MAEGPSNADQVEQLVSDLTGAWAHHAWSLTRLHVPLDGDVEAIGGVVDRADLEIRLVLSDAGEAIDLGHEPPDDSDIALVQRYLDDAQKARAVTATTRTELSRLVWDRGRELEIDIDRGAWAPDLDSLKVALESNWSRVATQISSEGQIGFGAETYPVHIRHEAVGAPTLIGLPQGSAAPPGLLMTLTALSDAHCWQRMAFESTSVGNDRVKIRLLPDSRNEIELEPGHARGGAALYAWLHSSADSNRREALTAALQQYSSANEFTEIPDGTNVLKAAQRLRIALATADMTSIVDAISLATREVESVVDRAREAALSMRRDTVRNSLGLAGAVLGIAGLLGRSVELPRQLVWLAAILATASLIGSTLADELSMRALGEDVLQLSHSLDSRGYLAESDREYLQARLDHASPASKVPRLGLWPWLSTLAACGLVTTAALSLPRCDLNLTNADCPHVEAGIVEPPATPSP